MAEETQRAVTECVTQYNSVKSLSHQLRLVLFRGVVTYLTDFIFPPMLEKTIRCVSVHAVTQVIMDLENDGDTMTIAIEPCEGEFVFLIFSCNKANRRNRIKTWIF